MKKVQALADAVAPRATTVLLLGDTGSGKGMLARYLHERSPRAAAPFVELNCAGLSRELTESELFGHERGAFTGATQRKLGLLEAADGGTLFLDEIGEMELAVQAKLLKVLEQGRFRRVGGIAELDVDVRIVAATHRDLEKDAVDGRFRADLYYRLNVFAIRLPPLGARKQDIAVLARRFLSEQRGGHVLGEEAIELLEDYDWPGNVRELRNVMERAAILAPDGSEITGEHLPPLGGWAGAGNGTLDGAEKAFFQNALKSNDGNILATARALGVSRGLLYRKIAKFGIKV
ncbi:MAG: sigma 54-interacting transcriptional regulator [Myxococcota bacterium]